MEVLTYGFVDSELYCTVIWLDCFLGDDLMSYLLFFILGLVRCCRKTSFSLLPDLGFCKLNEE